IYPPGVATDGSQRYHPKWVERHANSPCLRVMKLIDTNGGGAVVNFADYLPESMLGWSMPFTTPDSRTITPGAPLSEAWNMVAATNAKALWFNMGYSTTPACQRLVMQALFANLPPDVHLYLEASNEPWNGGTAPNLYFQALGEGEGLGPIQAYAKWAAAVFVVAREEAANAGRSSGLTCVFGSCGGDSSFTQGILDECALLGEPVEAIGIDTYIDVFSFH